MQFHEHKHFRRALSDLWKKGGPYQKAATEIEACLGRIAGLAGGGREPFEGMQLTKHGESRLRNAVKYDLAKFCRLITVQTDGYCILLYCGDHDDCDRWLEEHKGLQFVIGESKRVVETYSSIGEAEGERVVGVAGHYNRPLFERLPEDLYEALLDGVRPKVTRALETFDASVTDGDLWEVLAGIAADEQRMAVHDVFALLRADRVVEAIARIKQFQGELTPLEELPLEDLPEVVDSNVLRRIDPSSPQYAEALRRFMRAARYRDWMLFMHPDQDRIVDEDFDGPAKLVGVSGSGKTCVVVRRAVRLAERYPTERVLVLTLNRALAHLIDELVTACAPEEVRTRIEVKPFFALCRELLLEIDPAGDKLYDEITWKSNEHVDEVWQEYYRCGANNYDARVFQPVHDSLLARGWNPERYLRGEVDWIRSAIRPGDRSRYLTIERTGRKVVLPAHFREVVLQGAACWDEKMAVVGLVDALGIAQTLATHIDRITPRFRCVLVDEVQDFGNIELEIVRALVSPGENDVFLCGDAAQAVTTKHQRLRDIGMTIPGSRSRKLSQNYRNSRDVLAAAYEVLKNNLSEELLDREDLEIMDPEFAAFTGATPVLLQAADLAEELKAAFAYAKERIEQDSNAKVCIALCGFTLFELSQFGKRIGYPVLDGTASLDDGALFISDLAQTKGFEFDMVCVLNCSRGVIPDATAPDEEQYRDLAMLYVAMTRAKSDLVLSWSGVPSDFLRGSEGQFLAATWEDYVPGLADAPSLPIPRRLDASSEEQAIPSWRNMTGEQFLYTEHALGVSVELSGKIRALVDGKGLRRNGQRVKWPRLGDAVDAYRKDSRSRNQWGPEVGRQLIKLIERLPDLPQGLAGATGSTEPLVERGTVAERFIGHVPAESDETRDDAPIQLTEPVSAALPSTMSYTGPQVESATTTSAGAEARLTSADARQRLVTLRKRIWSETGGGPSVDGLLRKSMIDAFLQHRPTSLADLTGTELEESVLAAPQAQRAYLPEVFSVLGALATDL